MKTIILCVVFFMLFAFEVVEETHAQSVPKSVKQEISKQLSCSSTDKDIFSVKLGPNKNGYLGWCGGGGEAVLYEKTARGIAKIFEGETQMNGSVYLGKKAYGGYYEIIVNAHGATYSEETTYRWNGSRFVSHKCESCDVDSNGNMKNCKPC